MAVNDTEELAIVSSILGQELVNTYHFRLNSLAPPGSGTIEQILIDQFQTAAYTQYRAMIPTSVLIERISARQICGTPPLRVRIDETVGQLGTRGLVGDNCAPWLAALVRERTAFAGRSYQGRNFYVLGSETDFNQNSVAASVVTAINAFNTALLAAFGAAVVGSDFTLVVHSPTKAKVPGVQCQECSSPVVSLSTSPYLTTMKSRRSRSGA